jgi:hypothetical protein
MKNTRLLSLGVLLSAGSLLTSCSNDDGASDDSPVGSNWTLTVKATKGGNESTTRVLAEGTNPNTGKPIIVASWETTDNVYVYYNEVGGTYTEHGVLRPTANAADATLIGILTGFDDNFITSTTIDGAGFDIQLQFPRKGNFTWEGQRGTLADIAQKYDWATATVRVTAAKPVDDNNKTLDAGYATFVNQQAIVKFTLKDNAGDPLTPSSLTISATGLVKYVDNIGDNTGDVTITPTGSTNVIWAALRGISESIVTLTATVGNDIYSYTTKSPKTFANGKYYDITVKMTKK